ncbi:MAG: LacI family DNA-binding transcriptional regulator [Clostridium baratii]|uniref:LacI family DNA-binding transcriptional regulator n=1 Tax=Clostridium baratii TaxID=1561 RepID=UPI00242D2954|nr:LacI family DNA-binding transcriptional regulator [Clostridium baratii]MBS6043617.1 LacI family DNA-binding transcriptional regulator [Clostridium baratii]
MTKKVTTQDIADSLGVSRNTVSKALNGGGNMSEATRANIIQRAIEMKYKNFTHIEQEVTIKTIALVTNSSPTKSFFSNTLITSLENQIRDRGYTLSIFILHDDELNSLKLPNNFDRNNIEGIVCLELFDVKYSKLISSLGIPTIFIDAYSDVVNDNLSADIIMMENYRSIYSLTKKLILNNFTNLGFIGDYKHCRSFNERWIGFTSALLESNISLDKNQCILDDDSCPYNDINWLISRIKSMPKIPQGFICANDHIAINVMKALKEMNISIPDDILLCGFDDSPSSEIVEPKLTTVHIFNTDIGILAAKTLFDRISDSSIPYQTIYVNSEIKFRDSIGNINI